MITLRQGKSVTWKASTSKKMDGYHQQDCSRECRGAKAFYREGKEKHGQSSGQEGYIQSGDFVIQDLCFLLVCS
jgi:hypothetical protein